MEQKSGQKIDVMRLSKHALIQELWQVIEQDDQVLDEIGKGEDKIKSLQLRKSALQKALREKYKLGSYRNRVEATHSKLDCTKGWLLFLLWVANIYFFFHVGPRHSVGRFFLLYSFYFVVVHIGFRLAKYWGKKWYMKQEDLAYADYRQALRQHPEYRAIDPKIKKLRVMIAQKHIRRYNLRKRNTMPDCYYFLEVPLVEYLDHGRADTYKEALNLLESERYHGRASYFFKTREDKLRIISKSRKELKQSSR